jgi:16S rRNA C1402 N4-methylase RsmH
MERGTATVVDATLGLGGHTNALLSKFEDLKDNCLRS